MIGVILILGLIVALILQVVFGIEHALAIFAVGFVLGILCAGLTHTTQPPPGGSETR